MSTFLQQLEYDRRRQKEFGVQSLMKSFALGEQSERIKRENFVENRVLKNKLLLIHREEAAFRFNRKKELDSLEKLKFSINSPVSVPLNQKEIREFQGKLGYRPTGGHFTAPRSVGSGQGYATRSHSVGTCSSKKRNRMLTPEALREKQGQSNFRRARSVMELKTAFSEISVKE